MCCVVRHNTPASLGGAPFLSAEKRTGLHSVIADVSASCYERRLWSMFTAALRGQIGRAAGGRGRAARGHGTVLRRGGVGLGGALRGAAVTEAPGPGASFEDKRFVHCTHTRSSRPHSHEQRG